MLAICNRKKIIFLKKEFKSNLVSTTKVSTTKLTNLWEKIKQKSFEKFRSSAISLSETSAPNLCQKVRPKFGRTEFSVYH